MNKSSITRFALYGFYAVSIVNLYAQVMKVEIADFISKPLLMVTLLIYYLTARKSSATMLTWLVAAALVFSWVGDVLLMYQSRMANLFLFGLGAFLVAQVFYIIAYRNAIDHDVQLPMSKFVAFRLVFLIVYGGGLVFILHEKLGDLLIPVAAYTAVIIAMGISAILRKGKTSDSSFVLVYSGALLFIMSDSMIAINRFSHPLVQSGLLIMATYIAAQFLIVKGLLAHEEAIESEE
ncbi:MAG: lysoplasmalogenase [Cyclobacteriaceae bacterium]|nr:lysoplasmalogenase [Cyclobacteriaceae bacterium]